MLSPPRLLGGGKGGQGEGESLLSDKTMQVGWQDEKTKQLIILNQEGICCNKKNTIKSIPSYNLKKF